MVEILCPHSWYEEGTEAIEIVRTELARFPVQAFLFFKQFGGCVHRPNRRVSVKLG